MKKSKLLLVLASAFILSGCNLFNKGGNSEAPASSGSESSGSESSGSESSQAQGQSFSFADVVSSFAAEGVTGVVIPSYEAASDEATCEYVSAQNYYSIKGSSHDEMDVYAAALRTAGWSLEADSYGDYSGGFGETRAQVYLADYIGMSYDCILLQFSLAPENVFPSAEVAEYLAGKSWTDAMPAFSNALTTGFQFNAQYDQLIILTAEGSEDTLLAAVVSFYLSEQGGFSDGGVDAQGQYHLVSPNGQYELVAWDWPAQYPGYVIVNFQEYVAPATSFPVATVNEFLTTYELGFQLPADATYPGTGFSTEVNYSSNYQVYYMTISISGGEFAADYNAIIQPLLPTAYADYSEDGSYDYYASSTGHEVQISAANGATIITLWQ